MPKVRVGPTLLEPGFLLEPVPLGINWLEEEMGSLGGIAVANKTCLKTCFYPLPT